MILEPKGSNAHLLSAWAAGVALLCLGIGLHGAATPLEPVRAAVFKPEGRGADCQITLKFAEGKLAVGQKGLCDFGRGVSATGTYRKTSNRKPQFEEE